MIKLLRYLESYQLLLVIVVLMAVGQSAANLYLPNLMSDIVNKGISTFNTAFIWRTGGLMALVAVGGTVCALIGIYFSSG